MCVCVYVCTSHFFTMGNPFGLDFVICKNFLLDSWFCLFWSSMILISVFLSLTIGTQKQRSSVIWMPSINWLKWMRSVCVCMYTYECVSVCKCVLFLIIKGEGMDQNVEKAVKLYFEAAIGFSVSFLFCLNKFFIIFLNILFFSWAPGCDDQFGMELRTWIPWLGWLWYSALFLSFILLWLINWQNSTCGHWLCSWVVH